MAIERIETIPILQSRPQDSHKGLYGSILVIAGGRGMAGAAGLCGAGALRSGAGLVRVASAAEVQPTVASFEPSYMTYPLENDDLGFVRYKPARKLLPALLEKADVLAIGPGLGQSDDIRQLVKWVIENVEIPTIIDADGLNALVGQTDLLKNLKRPVILTPHPGEFGRLVGKPTAEIQANREGEIRALADLDHVVVVLKGMNTLVSDATRLFVNASGNPGMATGGVGDVLTGVIAALIGQKLPPFEASQLGAHAHGLAGDIARDQNGEIGMIAGDVVDSLADAFFHLMS